MDEQPKETFEEFTDRIAPPLRRTDGWPERRNGDQAALIDSLVRAVRRIEDRLETLDSKVSALGRHLQQEFHEGLERAERDGRRPYSLRAGLDDLSAVDTELLMWVRDALLVLDARMGDKSRLMKQIRSGAYDPEQAAAPRRKRE